jgi:hypothetical protein
VALIEIIQPLLALKFQFSDTSIMYMKDERSNLNTLEGPLSTMKSCKILELDLLFVNTCFGHMMYKVCY